jgi:spore germination cell wall hydrolase CwlJ-like protein
MTGPKLSLQTQEGGPLRQRVIAWGQAIRTWASTEIGGWIIVGALALTAVSVGAASVVLPRLNAAAPVIEPTARPMASTVPAALADEVVAFTLAPEALQSLDHAQARLWNAALPFSTDPIRPAAPLIAATSDIEAYSRALDCLTAAVYYEAASETAQGQAAVAQVVLNRTRHPAYPRTVCGVVFQGSERTTGCQFSFTCDGAMARTPSAAGWARARAVASAALNGTVVAAIGTATHYHTDWVAPYWAPRLSKIVQIGTHIFYRWKGAWGLPSAFTGVYSGQEPVVAKMANLSTFTPQAPVEILVADTFEVDAIVDPAPTVARTVVITPLEASASDDTAVEMAETVVEDIAPVRNTPVLQRDVPIMADPLVNPAAPQTRQRQRIAAPSGW